MLCKSGCHRLASRCKYDYSHNNNPRSLSCTADLSPISIPTGTFSSTLHALFGKELDCAGVVTATHTHHLLQNGLRPAPDNLHLGCSYHLHSSHSFLSTWGVVMLEKEKKKEKKVVFPGPNPNPNPNPNPIPFVH